MSSKLLKNAPAAGAKPRTPLWNSQLCPRPLIWRGRI